MAILEPARWPGSADEYAEWRTAVERTLNGASSEDLAAFNRWALWDAALLSRLVFERRQRTYLQDMEWRRDHE